MTATVSKSPAQAIAAALEKRIAPEQVATVLSDALTATTVSRSGAVEPDTRSRLQAAGMILAYQVGRPVERTEAVNINVDADSAIGMKERLAHSPALRAMLRKMLAAVEDENNLPAIDA
jgi:hypothetical protein